MEHANLRVAFLVGGDDHLTRQSVDRVCALQGFAPVAVLIDESAVSANSRAKNILQNIPADGWSHPFSKIIQTIGVVTTNAVNHAGVSRSEVDRTLKAAFPDTCFSLPELGEKYGMQVFAVESINSTDALRVLAKCQVDVAVVLDVGNLRAETLSVPRIGCVTLRKGKADESESTAPEFWELYEGASSVDVRVILHERGESLGCTILSSTVPVQMMDTPETLCHKLNAEGSRLLTPALVSIRDGVVTRRTQSLSEGMPRSAPTEADMALLQRRLPQWKQRPAIPTIGRNLFVLFVYYSGIYVAVRQWHRLSRSRGAIVLYHRVNDYSRDVLTVDRRTFAAQLLAISQRYPLSSTANIVDRILARKPLQPTTIAVHFDDCYRDIFTNGAPIMKALGVPACAFINSGFVDSQQTFPHDAGSPFTFEMLESKDVDTWVRLGFEVGAHTVNHVDLGTCPVEAARPEIVECGRELERMIGRPVKLFSFPFGRPQNIRDATMDLVRDAGYVANFSAHGGIIGPRADPYDIPRAGAHYESSPVYCLLQIEGLTLSRIARKVRSAWHRLQPSETVS